MKPIDVHADVNRDKTTKSRGRTVLGIAFAMIACWTGGAMAQSQEYPNKPIRFIVGFPPGGSTDLAARLIAPRLAERLGQPVIIDNRSGAGGNLAVDAIAKSAPDGYTIGFGVAGSLTINVTLQPKLPFDPVTDLTPITMAVNNPLILVSNVSFPAKDVRELIAFAKSKPGPITYGSGGTGTSMHLAGELLKQTAGLNLVHVPYKGTSPAVNDVAGGHLPLAIVDVASTLQFIKTGRLHALGVTGAKRTEMASDIPTISESGAQGFQVPSWFGIIGPARLPQKIVTRLNAELRAILESPDIRERFFAIGLEPAPTSPEEFGNIIKSEISRWAKVIKDAGIQVE